MSWDCCVAVDRGGEMSNAIKCSGKMAFVLVYIRVCEKRSEAGKCAADDIRWSVPDKRHHRPLNCRTLNYLSARAGDGFFCFIASSKYLSRDIIIVIFPIDFAAQKLETVRAIELKGSQFTSTIVAIRRSSSEIILSFLSKFAQCSQCRGKMVKHSILVFIPKFKYKQKQNKCSSKFFPICWLSSRHKL